MSMIFICCILDLDVTFFVMQFRPDDFFYRGQIKIELN